MIHNVKSGRCLDAMDSDPGGSNPNSLPNGTPIQLWDCWGGPIQQWIYRADGSIQNVKSGRCLDATDSDPGGNNPNSLPNGTPIQLWDCWGGPMQRWTGNSSFENAVVNSKANRCLDATDSDPGGNNPNSLPNGTRIELWGCWGGQMQAWYRTAAPMPVYCFFFSISGLFLERYQEMRGSERLGCPTGPEMNHPDGGGGRYQTFDGGAMSYSPNTGPNSVQMGYKRRHVHFACEPLLRGDGIGVEVHNSESASLTPSPYR